jgi:GNAT superfamily N-acetyltransferase
VTHRFATQHDYPLLAHLNRQLIEDERHRNRMSLEKLEERMRAWLAGPYKAVLFDDANDGLVGYALFRIDPEVVYLRHLFILRHFRRKGHGTAAVRILKEVIWPKDKRLTVEVLAANEPALNFWRSVGYRDYSVLLEIPPPEQS